MRTVVMILMVLLVWAVPSPAADSGIREGAREARKGPPPLHIPRKKASPFLIFDGE